MEFTEQGVPLELEEMAPGTASAASAAGDTWGKEFDEAMKLLNELGPLLDERNDIIRKRQDPSRVVATARRKLTMLTTKADRLEALLNIQREQSKL